MRTTTLLPFALAFLATVGTAACAAPEETTTDTGSEEALTADQVLPEGAQTLLEGITASADAQKQLGVTNWSAHLVSIKEYALVGALLVGTDRDGQVAYVVAVSANSEGVATDRASVQFIRYGADGVAADQAFDDAAKRALSDETGRISGLVAGGSSSLTTQTSRVGSAAICVAPLAVGLLAAGATAAVGAYVAATAAQTGMFALLAGPLLVHVGAPVVGIGTTAIGTGVAFAFKGWRHSCYVAIHGS